MGVNRSAAPHADGEQHEASATWIAMHDARQVGHQGLEYGMIPVDVFRRRDAG